MSFAASTAQGAKRPAEPLDSFLAKRARLTDSVQPSLEAPIPISPKLPSFLQNPAASDRDAASISVARWAESIGSSLYRYTRSENGNRPASQFPSPQRTRSAPEMNMDADGFRVPMTPSTSTPDVWFPDSSEASVARSASSRRGGAKHPQYRLEVLADNNITLCHPYRDKLPPHITRLIDRILEGCDLADGSLEPIDEIPLGDLWEESPESQVIQFFSQSAIFPAYNSRDVLRRDDRQPMVTSAVPNTQRRQKVSTPVPDMLYGYRHGEGFLEAKRDILGNAALIANNANLLLPFFAIECKGDGPGGLGGSLWVSTNQCLGASASCVNIVERVNERIRAQEGHGGKIIDNAVFSIAMNGTEIRLYVTWKSEDQKYRMGGVRDFLVRDPDHFMQFRKYVRSILKWGEGVRLKEIKECINLLGPSQRRGGPRGDERGRPLAREDASRPKRQRSETSAVTGRRSDNPSG